MAYRFRKISHKEYLSWVDFLCKELNVFMSQKNLKVDYVVPILRSGAVPAVYIANRLNLVKFAPIQVKHVETNEGKDELMILFNAFDCLEINKKILFF